MYVLQQTQRPFQEKLKAAPITLPMIPSSASAAFPASLLSASASLSNHFFRVPLPFGGEPPAPPMPPPKTPSMARTIVAMVIERAVTTEAMVLPCSRNKVRIPSARDVSLSITFSMVCLILAT